MSQGRSDTVDLSTDTSLVVDISDALSERDKVKFTVHTKVSKHTSRKEPGIQLLFFSTKTCCVPLQDTLSSLPSSG